MKLACASAIVPGETLTEKAANLRQWGYDGIAVFADHDTWSEKQHQELLSLERDTGITPCEFVFSSEIYGHLMDPDPTLRHACRQMYHQAAQICSELGAVTELEFSYGPQSPLPLFSPYTQMNQEDEAEFIALYRELTVPLLGSSGAMLLEGINRYESPYLNSIRDCADLIKKMDTPNTGVLADFFHMSIEEADLAESIRYAGPLIRHVHLGDSNRLLPGRGHTDWESAFRALKDIGYSGYLVLECSPCGDPAETLPETARLLKKWIGGE